MSIYEEFAKVYDTFMEEVNYDGWFAHLKATWKQLGIIPENIIDLGCGTGTLTLLLAKEGYQVLGVDFSEDMLAQTEQKAYKENLKIPLFCQDMGEFLVPMEADCVLCCCDGLNYLIEDGELEETFMRVGAHLKPKGVFLFDMNTKYKFKEILGNQTYAATTEEAAYFWENQYDEEDNINSYYLNLFLKQGGKDTYERKEECHYERAYAKSEIIESLKNTGFDVLGCYDGYSFEAIHEESQRYFFVARLKEDITNG